MANPCCLFIVFVPLEANSKSLGLFGLGIRGAAAVQSFSRYYNIKCQITAKRLKRFLRTKRFSPATKPPMKEHKEHGGAATDPGTAASTIRQPFDFFDLAHRA